ncbi:MAG: MoaD/ThiS family protein [Pseudomonadota bacterium]
MSNVTVKLFASLADYLPSGAKENTTSLKLPEAGTIGAVIEELRVPEQRCHLVLLNGIFVPPARRTTTQITDGDTIAIWPPVAGG